MFDFIIFFALAIFALGIIYSIYCLAKKKDLAPKRKAWLIVLLIICLVAEITLVYGSFIEPRRITITHESFQLSDNNDQTIKVALMADLHLGPYKKEKFVSKICKKLEEQKPDLVLLAGDLIAAPGHKEKQDRTKHLRALECISNKYPTYAVMGNHEYNIGLPHYFEYYYDQTDKIKNIFTEIDIKILENESILFEKNDSKFWLLGVDEVWANENNLNQAMANTNSDYPKILLAHNPDIFSSIAKTHNIGLTLCGHTHAGQIQLPLIGTIVTPPSRLGRACYESFCKFENTTMFITRGIGETGPRARLFAPPEIAILELAF